MKYSTATLYIFILGTVTILAAPFILVITHSASTLMYDARRAQHFERTCLHVLPEYYRQLDPRNFIRIHSADDSTQTRRNIIRHIWKSDALPTTTPDTIIENPPSPRELDLASVTENYTVQALEISTAEHLTSTVYVFTPASSNNRLVLFHHGHSSRLTRYGINELMASLLQRGFTVALLYMPAHGPNTSYPNHNDMEKLASDTVQPLKFFLEPVIVTLNYFDTVANFDSIAMTGLSGGGWTTTLIAAIDPRIKTSIPIAGSLPLHLRQGECATRDEVGDWEQGAFGANRELYYDIASYLDLYILGASGAGRSQIQLLNQFDSCCFNGLRYTTYENEVKSAVQNIDPGMFSVALDSTHKKHLISPWALEKIILPVLLR